MKFDELALYISVMSPIVLTLGVLTCLIMYKRLSITYKQVFFYLSLMLGVDIFSRIVWSLYNVNLIVLPLYSLLELVFFVYFYNKYLFAKPNIIIISLGVLGGIYIIVEMLLYFVFNTLNVKQFQPYCKVIDNFIIIIMALFFFQQKISNFKESGWGNFRLNTVLLLFFTLNTIIFLPFNFLINGTSEVKFYFWIFHSVNLGLFYTLLTFEVLKDGRKLK